MILGDDRLLDSQQLRRPDHPAQQAAQHITTTVITGADAVGDDDRRGPAVVGDDPIPDVVFVASHAVTAGGDACDEVDHRAQQIRLVDVVHILQQAGDAFDAHAGVDVLARQRAEDLEVLLRCPRAALVLHEHEIPDLDVAVFVGFWATLRAVLRAAVVIDLRRRTARTGDAHRPVVVGHPAALDPLCRHVRDLEP